MAEIPKFQMTQFQNERRTDGGLGLVGGAVSAELLRLPVVIPGGFGETAPPAEKTFAIK